MNRIIICATLVLVFFSCNKDNYALIDEHQKGIKITATLSAKNNDVLTHAVADGGSSILVSWAKNEKIAVLYETSGIKKMAVANIDAVDGTTGSASISFIVDEGTQEGAACTLVYPSSAAKDDYSGVKDVADLLGAQNGTLSANLDVRVGAGIIHTVTPGLAVTIQPEAQFAIFKFTLKNIDASADILVKPLIISIASQNYTINPSSAQSVLYVALPAISGEDVVFSATGNTMGNNVKNFEFSKTNVSFAAGKYYQSTLQMIQEETIPAGCVAVDLGLSVKWANMNVGATKPSEWGNYYCWGETTTNKSSYTWNSYKWGGPDSFTKYSDSNSSRLQAIDDVAQQEWGGKWRMPTKDEMQELIDNSSISMRYNGVGTLVSGPYDYLASKNGETIVLPIGGYYFNGSNGNTVSDRGSTGYCDYWSSNLNTESTNSAWILRLWYGSSILEYSNYIHKNVSSSTRNLGITIRPVQDY